MKVAGKKRKCGICGKKFNANSHNQRYCSEECRCTARRNKAYKWYQKNKDNKKSEKTLADINKIAKSKGLTYGQYMILLQTEKDRKERVKIS